MCKGFYSQKSTIFCAQNALCTDLPAEYIFDVERNSSIL